KWKFSIVTFGCDWKQDSGRSNTRNEQKGPVEPNYWNIIFVNETTRRVPGDEKSPLQGWQARQDAAAGLM
ncbi:hypothetical protein J6590_045828, partial [Homalodisca vitripennis]